MHNGIDTDVGWLSWKWKFSSYSERYQSSKSIVVFAFALSPCTRTWAWVVHEKGDSVTNINETKKWKLSNPRAGRQPSHCTGPLARNPTVCWAQSQPGLDTMNFTATFQSWQRMSGHQQPLIRAPTFSLTFLPNNNKAFFIYKVVLSWRLLSAFRDTNSFISMLINEKG